MLLYNVGLGTSIEIKTRDVTRTRKYNWTYRSSDVGVKYPVDRGPEGDTSAGKITIIEKYDRMQEITQWFDSVIHSDDPNIVASEVTGEYLFGFDVDYSTSYSCVLVGVPEVFEQRTLNSYTIKFELKHDEALTYLSVPAGYPNITCYNHDYNADTSWDFKTTTTYNNINQYVLKRGAYNNGIFVGTSRMTFDKLQQLQAYERTIRGGSFNETTGVLTGSIPIWGPRNEQTSATVQMRIVKIEDINSQTYDVTIEYTNAVPAFVGVAPVFTLQPVDQTITAGDTAVFTYAHTGDSAQAYKRSTFFEAGTVEYPFAGTLGSPVSSDPNWGPASFSPTNLVDYYGEYAVLQSVPGGNYMISLDNGDVTSAMQTVSFNNYTGTPDQYWGIIGDGGAPNRVGVYFSGGTGGNPFGVVKMYVVNNSVLTLSASLGNVGSQPKSGVFDITVSGTDVLYDITIVNQLDTSFNWTGTYANGYNPAVTYGLYQSSNLNNTIIQECRIEGVGFPNAGDWLPITGETTSPLEIPNVGTTGDPIGTQYKIVASNANGNTDSNIVTTIEA